jgi:hypothetical protein
LAAAPVEVAGVPEETELKLVADALLVDEVCFARTGSGDEY